MENKLLSHGLNFIILLFLPLLFVGGEGKNYVPIPRMGRIKTNPLDSLRNKNTATLGKIEEKCKDYELSRK